MSSATVVDLFAGPGGWSVGLSMLGLEDVGVEWDADACRTRRNAGHLTVRADVATYPPEAFQGAWGLIASPPCPDWSTAGKGAGRDGSSGWLVDLVPRWVDVIRPRWICCEQVVPALGVWFDHAELYRAMGYRVWAGVLDAANFGVPQNRRRAVLIASLDGPVQPPPHTHHSWAAQRSLFPSDLWVTLADALGLGHGWWYDSGQNTTRADGTLERYRRSCDRPAGTLTTKTVGQWVLRGPHGERAKLTEADSLTIQTFPAGYPFHGGRESRQRQVGNAVPPLMAAHIAAAATGLPAPTPALAGAL